MIRGRDIHSTYQFPNKPQPKNTHMLGQQDILNLLAGPKAGILDCNLVLDMNNPEEFERGYRIAMQMPSCYTSDPYYIPTYHLIHEAYKAKNPRLMDQALTRLCIDISYR